MATHSSILAWRITWTEEPGGLQFIRVARSRTRLSNECFSLGSQSPSSLRKNMLSGRGIDYVILKRDGMWLPGLKRVCETTWNL